MNHTKIQQLRILLALHPAPTTERGRKPSPFITAPDGSTRFPHSRAAYASRLHDFKILTAIDQELPTLDPIAATKKCLGSVRRTLWLYLYDCLTDFPEKKKHLADLLATHNANLLNQGIEKIIVERLVAGCMSDAEFAAIVLDDQRLRNFAERWFARPKGRGGRDL